MAAEADHRRLSIIETVIRDLEDSTLAQLPSGTFHTNAAWLALAAMVDNLPAPWAPSSETVTNDPQRHDPPPVDLRPRVLASTAR